MTAIENILLVDDDEESRISIAEFLDEYGGYSVIQAENGSDGFNKWMDNRDTIDLVISHYHMPGMNGMNMIRQGQIVGLKAMAILISSDHEPLMKDICFLDGFMAKPFVFIDLVKMIEELEQTF